MQSTLRILILVASSVILISTASAQTEKTTSVRDGVYTEIQARRGEQTYSDVCIACHMQEWFAEPFLASWNGAMVSALYELISTTMPEDRPGGLEQEQYADVLAYIFQLNGLPVGDMELLPQKETLGKILIEWRK